MGFGQRVSSKYSPRTMSYLGHPRCGVAYQAARNTTLTLGLQCRPPGVWDTRRSHAHGPSGRWSPPSESYSRAGRCRGSPWPCRGVARPPRHCRSSPPKIGGNGTPSRRPRVTRSGWLARHNMVAAQATKCGIVAEVSPLSLVQRNDAWCTCSHDWSRRYTWFPPGEAAERRPIPVGAPSKTN